jgi:hypothetical protein
MLINRTLELARLLGRKGRLLRGRARARGERLPLVVVPGACGSRLRADGGRRLWGGLSNFYRGPSFAAAEEPVAADGIFEGLALVPGLWSYDIYGGLLRFLEDAGGYRRGEDLHVFDYDWRKGVAEAAAELARMVTALRGAGEERIDLCASSSGGAVVRTFLGYGAADPLAPDAAPPPDEGGGGSRMVRRVIYLGAPQRGTFDALATLHRGYRFAPGGRLVTAAETALCQSAFDLLPHPDDPVFVDGEGQRVATADLYDARFWRAAGIGPAGGAGHAGRSDDDGALAARLDRARRLHRALDRAAPHADSFVIGARHRPTPCRAVLAAGSGRAEIPPPAPRRYDPHVAFTYAPGDGELPEASLRALPGLPADRLWVVEPRAHARLQADPATHRLVLEALLATDRHIPVTDLGRKRRLPLAPDA